MMLVKTYIGPSGIHGTGLFAGETIAKGTKIWEFMPGLDVEIPVSRLASLNEPILSYINRYTYPHHMLPDMLILDGDNGRFMNHSDSPNTDFSQTGTAGYYGYAIADIAEGEEIICNYAEFHPGFDLD